MFNKYSSNKKNNGEPQRLGDKLLDMGIIDEKCLRLALRKQEKEGGKIGDALVDLGLVEQEIITKILASEAAAGFIKIDEHEINPEAMAAIPSELARKLKVMPFDKKGDVVFIACEDPLDPKPMDTIWQKLKIRAKPYGAALRDIETAIDKYYGSTETIDEIVDIILEGRIEDKQLEAPVVRLVDKIVLYAIQNTATDIHIEPEEKTVAIRARIDGELTDITILPKAILQTLVSRVKILASLDVSEKRLPQDGSYSFKMGKNHIEIRVSTMPTIYGEKAVMRILDKETVKLSLDGIALPEHIEKEAETKLHLNDPYGMILVTGPTGSGKTTTLYSMLNAIKSSEKAIYTIEDPVEYKIKGIQQIQVNEEIGLGFDTVLRGLLRLDPDIIMVGEIRDQVTANLAIHAALTGHLVLSTLHTNNSIETIHRLIDMDVDPFLIPASLHGVMAQRLVRKLCPHCKKEIDPKIAQSVVRREGLPLNREWRFWQGEGCSKCYNGFKGRIAIFEWLDISHYFHEAITRRASMQELRKIAEESGFISMREDGLTKAAAGLTTIEEVMRATKYA